MREYSNLKINREVAENFRKYSKIIGQKHSQTLQLFIDFFNNNNIRPTDEISGSLIALENKILQRIEALIKIIRGIEKEDIKRDSSAKKMLYELTVQFANSEAETLPMTLEDPFNSNDDNSEQKQYQEKVKNLTGELLLFFDKIEKSKSNLGESFYKINTNQNEITKLKRILKSI